MNEETLRKQRACAGEKKPSMQHLKQSCNRHCMGADGSAGGGRSAC